MDLIDRQPLLTVLDRYLRDYDTRIRSAAEWLRKAQSSGEQSERVAELSELVRWQQAAEGFQRIVRGAPGHQADGMAAGPRSVQDAVLSLVGLELDRATQLHGAMHSALEGWAVLHEELDEVRAEVHKGDPGRMFEETVHLAATAVRFCVDLCCIGDLTPTAVKEQLGVSVTGERG